MNLNPTDLKPIYIQIAEGIEDDILKGILAEDTECYSQYQISRNFSVNPATAAKGINLLVQEGILYKVRGLGMHVSKGAKVMIQKKRRNQFFTETVKQLLFDAKKLDITNDEIKKMIDELSQTEVET